MTDTTRLWREPERTGFSRVAPVPQAGFDPRADPTNWQTQPIPAVQTATTARPSQPPRPAGMYVMAAAGVVLVLYSYLVALWPVRHGFTPDVVLATREWLSFPLGVGADFGLFGIGLLLAAGGFWACDRLTRPGLGRGRLLWQVVARGYLPYVLACTLSYLLLLGNAEPFTEPRRPDPEPGTLPLNLLLAERLAGHDSLIGLGWAVAAAFLTAVLIALTAPLLTRSRWLALTGLAVQLVVISAVVLTAAAAGGWYHKLGELTTWCMFALVGQLAWVVRRHPGSGWPAGPIGVGCLAVFVAAEHGYQLLAEQWLPVTLLFVALVVLLAARAPAHGGKADSNRVVRWLGSRAYPAVLLACALGYPLVGGLYYAKLPFGFAVLIAIAVTLALAEAVHRLSVVIAR